MRAWKSTWLSMARLVKALWTWYQDHWIIYQDFVPFVPCSPVESKIGSHLFQPINFSWVLWSLYLKVCMKPMYNRYWINFERKKCKNDCSKLINATENAKEHRWLSFKNIYYVVLHTSSVLNGWSTKYDYDFKFSNGWFIYLSSVKIGMTILIQFWDDSPPLPPVI